MTEKCQQYENIHSIIRTLLCEPTDEKSVQTEGMGKSESPSRLQLAKFTKLSK